MVISILTLFPQALLPILQTSILKRAQEKKLVTIKLVNIRDQATGKYKSVDDKPYGGGVGMIMRVDILYNAIQNVKCYAKGGSNVPGLAPRSGAGKCRERTVLLDPKGKQFTQATAKELTKFDHLILICGHYEGVDARIERYVDESISIGDFVLTGGEIPAMVITDAVVRLIAGVLKPQATADESFSLLTDNEQPERPTTILEYPQYTRPKVFKNQKVPDVLLSGNHKKIEEWKKSKQVKI